MRVIVVTPPDPVVSYEEAVARLRLDGSEEERVDVESMIAAATAHIDGPDGWLGRALGPQTLELRTDIPPYGLTICLPCRPILSLVSVKYLDANDVEQTADLADFELLGHTLVPAGSSWPWDGGSSRPEALRIRYEAGYALLPAPIKAAILLMVGDFYRFRATVSVAASQAITLPCAASVAALLSTYRVFS